MLRCDTCQGAFGKEQKGRGPRCQHCGEARAAGQLGCMAEDFSWASGVDQDVFGMGQGHINEGGTLDHRI
jgi:hypothetical protein